MAGTARKRPRRTTSVSLARAKAETLTAKGGKIPASVRLKIRDAASLSGLKLRHALERLAQAGMLHGARSRKLSARVDPGLIKAPKRRTGIAIESDLVNAALAGIA